MRNRIGLVGDIGSGKSFISSFFKYPVFNADKAIIKIYRQNKSCYYKLKKVFPNSIKKFPIKKKEIISLIFEDERNLRKLGNIIHPYVNKELKKFLKKNKKKKDVLDIPLLLENKIMLPGLFYVFIHSKKSHILQNLKKRPNFNKKLYKLMKKNQLPLIYKRRKSEFVINNDFRSLNFIKKINLIKREIKQK